MTNWLAVGSMMLVAGSWRLWTPQTLFPRVPLFSFALGWPDAVDQVMTWLALVMWLIVTAVLTWPKLSVGTSRAAALGYAILFGLLVVLDQHRLQPWAVHIAVCLLIVTAMKGRQLLSWYIAFTASIYLYSAISKFDAQFLHTVGQDFLAGLMRVWPGAYASLSENARFVLAAMFPIGELLCGLALLWNVSRKAALGLAIVMHGTLIAILGPWGLGHSWGVLLWNAVFIGLNLLTWRALAADSQAGAFRFTWKAEGSLETAGKVWRGCVVLLVSTAMIVPLGERLGVVDHWLGWALYAPHSSRARIELLSGAAERQLPVVQRFVKTDPEAISAWDYLAVERWSLETLGVPVYPQQRFYVGVAVALAKSAGEFDMRVTLLGTADRWSGARQQRLLENRTELERAAGGYWFNTQPRW